MSLWVTGLVWLAVLFFGSVAVYAASVSEWKAFGVFAAIMAFCALAGGIGWFTNRLDVPPLPPGSDRSLMAQVRHIRKHQPGWQGRILVWVVPCLLIAVAVQKIVALLMSL